MDQKGSQGSFEELASLVLTPATALEGLREGVVLSDPKQPDNPVVYANPTFYQMTGYEKEEVIGRNCRFLQGEKTDPAAVALIREALTSAQPVTVELLNYRRDGSPFWNRLTISPVNGPDGRLSHFIAIQRDVTSYRQMQEELKGKENSVAALEESVALLKKRITEQEESIASFIMHS